MIVNTYKEGSFSQKLKRELKFVLRYIFFFFRNGFRNKNVLFYPEYPDNRAAIFRVMDALGYNVINNPGKQCKLAFFWEDKTYREENRLLTELSQRVPVLNLNCRDISKTRVEEVFQEVFGYGTFVDPTTHTGKCVRKSDLNAKHDGTVIECPVPSAEPGFIYQRLLEQIDKDRLAVDYRVAIFGSSIGYFKLRYKRLEDRFAHTILERIKETDDYLSSSEQANILEFCRELGMDYGELDMIRDQSDGRLYILDANSTPFRPPPDFNVPDEDRKLMVSRSAQAFAEKCAASKRREVPRAQPVEPVGLS